MPSALRPYIVKQGDHLFALAARYGFDPASVWHDAKNDALRNQRQDDGHVLLPGDVLYIPEVLLSWLPLTLGAVNTFVAPSCAVGVQTRFVSRGVPLAGEPYVVIGADVEPGSLDQDGFLRATVPATVKAFEVHLTGRNEIHVLRVGHLDPADAPSGTGARLSMLGIYGRGAGTRTGSDEDLEFGLQLFQRHNGLPVTGEADGATRQKLLDLFGR